MRFIFLGALTALPLALACGPWRQATAAPPLGVGVAWEPIPELSDEFDTVHPNARADGINDTKWWDYHPVWSGRLPSQFSAANSWVEGGKLNLRSTPLVESMDEVTDERNQHWIDSAAVVSKVRAEPGGYYEASIKTADISLPSSFWFRMGTKSEIDVIENIGNPARSNLEHRRSEMSYNTHFYNPPPDVAVGGHVQMTDAQGNRLFSSENFITYAVWWKSPQEVLFYYNDIEVANVTPAGPFDEDLHMIFDMEAFHWVGFPTIEELNDPAKNTMQVDWVRAYRAIDLQPGDYNADGDINVGDYLAWSEGYGQSGPNLPADGNGDGAVDAADYTVLRDALAASAVTVPEPAGFGVWLAGLLGVTGVRPRWRRIG